jgi:hypothetical protein
VHLSFKFPFPLWGSMEAWLVVVRLKRESWDNFSRSGRYLPGSAALQLSSRAQRVIQCPERPFSNIRFGYTGATPMAV